MVPREIQATGKGPTSNAAAYCEVSLRNTFLKGASLNLGSHVEVADAGKVVQLQFPPNSTICIFADNLAKSMPGPGTLT
jgi:hypothetical protein